MQLGCKVISILASLGVGITSTPNLITLFKKSEQLNDVASKIQIFEAFYRKSPNEFSKFLTSDLPFLDLLRGSKSQIGQDLVALSVNGFKRKGFFVEFGAADGVSNSNTFLLEKHYEWEGILAEPARFWKDDLVRSRSAKIDFNCVWSTTGQSILFNETASAELSTIDQFSNCDSHEQARSYGEKYKVNSISLTDLLDKHDAPFLIDYLSIDTEGSEFEILNSFDFSKYSIGFISCEHNYGPNRERISELLFANGYSRVYTEFSAFDDWYVQESLIKSKGLIETFA